MADEVDKGDDPSTNPRQWKFPTRAGESREDDDEPADDDIVSLCHVSAQDAEQVSALLQSAMLPHSLKQTTPEAIEILVLQEDLEVAQEILANPPQDDDDEDEEDPEELRREREQRLIADWICPKCQRRDLVLTPLSKGWRRVRRSSLLVIAIPFIADLLPGLFPGFPEFHPNSDFWIPALLLLALFLALAPMMANRQRRCKSCGWESGSAPLQLESEK